MALTVNSRLSHLTATVIVLAFLREGIEMPLRSDWSDKSCPIACGLEWTRPVSDGPAVQLAEVA